MADYRFELGIDWNSVIRADTLAYLQVGFVNMASPPSVAAPIGLQAGDTIAFVIFDTTIAGASPTGSIESLQIAWRVASTNSTNSEPFPTGTFSPTRLPPAQSVVFKNTYSMWETSMATSINSGITGRYRLTITITARNHSGQTMTWSDDPEMVVGGFG